MHHITRVLITAVIASSLTACSNPGDENAMPEIPEIKSVTGTISYRQKILLGPAATVDVKLLDVSKADTIAVLMAEQTIPNPGQIPIAFELLYNPAIVKEGMSYVVRATIYDGDRMQFVTDTAYPVLTRGAGNKVDLVLVPANNDVAAALNSDLLNNTWELISIRGVPVAANSQGKKPTLTLDLENGSASGFTGCNSFSGGYGIVDGNPKIDDNIAVTMMACVEDMQTEAAYLQALSEIEGYQVAEGQLRTYSGGQELMIFKAVPPETQPTPEAPMKEIAP